MTQNTARRAATPPLLCVRANGGGSGLVSRSPYPQGAPLSPARPRPLCSPAALTWTRGPWRRLTRTRRMKMKMRRRKKNRRRCRPCARRPFGAPGRGRGEAAPAPSCPLPRSAGRRAQRRAPLRGRKIVKYKEMAAKKPGAAAALAALGTGKAAVRRGAG